jgi:uncharacterized protein (TIGR02145 family)
MNTKTQLMTIAFMIFAIHASAQVSGIFTDSRDGKQYKTVKIGTQTWMSENLAFKATSGCYAYENIENNAIIYGYLYNWETANKVCPSGWHLPSKIEWATLNEYLGGDSLAHIKLIEVGNGHWKNPDPTVTNESGFTALPGGLFSASNFRPDIKFQYVGNYGYWWSATEDNEPGSLNAWFRVLGDYFKNEEMDVASKVRGSSIRSIKN